MKKTPGALKGLFAKVAAQNAGAPTANYLDIRKREKTLTREEIAGIWADHLAGLAPGKDNVNCYVHIPYCTSECNFCQYFFWDLEGRNPLEGYTRRLIERVESFAPVFRKIALKSLYFGGGTPSLLTTGQLGRLFEALHRSFRFEPEGEKTFECNPSSTTPEKLQVLGEFGINRVSFGVQSLNGDVLRHMRRDYQRFASVKAGVEAVRRLGKPIAVNLDLVIGSLKDTPESAVESFTRLSELGPDSISLYPLLPTSKYLKTLYGGDEAHFRAELEGKVAAFFRKVEPALARFGYVATVKDMKAPEILFDSWKFMSKAYLKTWSRQRYAYSSSAPNDCLGLGTYSLSHIFGKTRYDEVPGGGYRGVEFKSLKEQKLHYVVNKLITKKLSLRVYEDLFGSALKDDFPLPLRLLTKSKVLALKKGQLSLRSMDPEHKLLYSLLFTA